MWGAFSCCKRILLISICRKDLFLVWQLLGNITFKISGCVLAHSCNFINVFRFWWSIINAELQFLNKWAVSIAVSKGFFEQTKSLGENYASTFLWICHFLFSFNGYQICETKTVAVGEHGWTRFSFSLCLVLIQWIHISRTTEVL